MEKSALPQSSWGGARMMQSTVKYRLGIKAALCQAGHWCKQHKASQSPLQGIADTLRIRRACRMLPGQTSAPDMTMNCAQDVLLSSCKAVRGPQDLVDLGYAFMANVMKLDQDTIAYTHILELVSMHTLDELPSVICLHRSQFMSSRPQREMERRDMTSTSHMLLCLCALMHETTPFCNLTVA